MTRPLVSGRQDRHLPGTRAGSNQVYLLPAEGGDATQYGSSSMARSIFPSRLMVNCSRVIAVVPSAAPSPSKKKRVSVDGPH